MQRRGISAIISTVLLISLVVALAGVYLLWSKNLFSNVTSGTAAQQSCSALDFDVADFCLNTQGVYDQASGGTVTAQNLKFDIRNNAPETNISAFLVSLVDAGGNSRLLATQPFSQVNNWDSKQLITDYLQGEENTTTKTLVLVPEVAVKDKLAACGNQQVSIPWSEVKKC